MSESKTSNSNHEKYKCRKCKPIKYILGLLTLTFLLLFIASLVSPRTIYVQKRVVEYIAIESQTSSASASVSSVTQEISESAKGETIRTGGK
jgi:hypothetical protein